MTTKTLTDKQAFLQRLHEAYINNDDEGQVPYSVWLENRLFEQQEREAQTALDRRDQISSVIMLGEKPEEDKNLSEPAVVYHRDIAVGETLCVETDEYYGKCSKRWKPLDYMYILQHGMVCTGVVPMRRRIITDL